ncbi:hypothetical protein T11_17341 [Trichinella zimbabwensis]|uniref:Uncharacterized protein n=1 Tax=Trichinella zimbabwensis TaxID=268475 RepID=A0A0V1GTN1_9BILA|nr:hypothetical protein T11_17341 [Trichinella zimbabwensis]
MEDSFLWENDSVPDVNRAQLLGKYGSGTYKKWQSWVWENITNREKDEAEEENGTGLEKKGRGMLWEHRRKREKDGEDFLEENESMPEKKRSLLVRGKRHGGDKMNRTWFCKNTVMLNKDGGEFFLGKRLRTGCISSRVLEKVQHQAAQKLAEENDSELNKKREQLLKRERHRASEKKAVFAVGKQQKAAKTGRRFFGGKFLCPGQKTAELFKGKQLWARQKACPVLGWKMAQHLRIMGRDVRAKLPKTGKIRRRFFRGK